MNNLFCSVVDIPNYYNYLLTEGLIRYKGKDASTICRWIEQYITAAEALNFVGLDGSAGRWRCPFHDSHTGRTLSVMAGNRRNGQIVSPYPRIWCMEPTCQAHHSLTIIEFMHALYAPTTRRELGIILLTAKRKELLVDDGIPLKLGTAGNPKSFIGRLRRLKERRGKYFNESKAESANWEDLPSVRIGCRYAFPSIFTEPQGRLFVLKSCDYRDVKTRDEWLRCRLAESSFVSPNYLKENAEDTGRDNFKPRIWLVIEGDNRLSLEEQIEVHHSLDGYRGFQLALLCWSGNKSIHGWYEAESRSDVDCFRLCWKAVYRGMDCYGFNHWMPVRLPGGWNYDKKQRQQIIEWNL